MNADIIDYHKYYNSYDELFFESQTKRYKKTHAEILKVINKYNQQMDAKILDVGGINPFTTAIQQICKNWVDNTEGDLDYIVNAPKKDYDIIVISHVIEHLMNPLFVLCELNNLLSKNGKIIIAYPTRNIKTQHHFHEIPIKDIRLLIGKAGLEIISIESHKVKHQISFGIRPLLKLIMSYKDRNHIIVCKQKQREVL